MSNSANLWTVAHQAPLTMRFPRQEYWSRLSFPSPGGLPDPGMEPMSPASPALASRFFTSQNILYYIKYKCHFILSYTNIIYIWYYDIHMIHIHIIYVSYISYTNNKELVQKLYIFQWSKIYICKEFWGDLTGFVLWSLFWLSWLVFLVTQKWIVRFLLNIHKVHKVSI